MADRPTEEEKSAPGGTEKAVRAAGDAPESGEGLVYRGRPLRRVGSMIYYGSMADPYIILMQIKETRREKDLDLASRVSVELQRTAPDLRSRDRVVKRSEKDSLFHAMDISAVWLERALAGRL